MGAGYLVISAASTVLSYVGLYYWAELPLSKLKFGDLMNENLSGPETLKHDVELLQGSYLTIALLANFVFNVFILLNICLKTMFFAKLYPAESRKLVERLVNYVIYKGTFLPLVIPPTLFSLGLWSTWLTVVCSLKMFQALARDRLERLNASPSAIPCRYFRVYSALLFVLSADLYWIRLCFEVYRSLGSSVLLLFFEPLSIAFETLQAMLIHGFQLLDILSHHTQGENAKCKRLKFFDKIKSAGSLSEWKGILIRNWGFSLDMGTLLMALGHYVHIWWLKGIAFHLVDAVLFLNIRALLGAIIKRIKGFMKMKIALGTLHAALPDATSEELRAYDDECAICREPMAKAKKLQCNHLFHLACLRSWLDQGLSDNYSCPTCRKPLFFSRPTNNPHLQNREVLSDEQLARQISEGLNRNIPGHSLPLGVIPNQIQNSIEGNPWRSADLDSSWLDTWPAQGLDVPGSSTSVRPVGLGRVQMMMRHLASVGETYAQTTLEDTSWNLWPSLATTSGNPIPHNVGGRYPGAMGVRHTRTASLPVIDNMANVLAMAETVRDVLPHVPDELIVQDLQRTNSVAVTVNNLLQM